MMFGVLSVDSFGTFPRWIFSRQPLASSRRDLAGEAIIIQLCSTTHQLLEYILVC